MLWIPVYVFWIWLAIVLKGYLLLTCGKHRFWRNLWSPSTRSQRWTNFQDGWGLRCLCKEKILNNSCIMKLLLWLHVFTVVNLLRFTILIFLHCVEQNTAFNHDIIWLIQKFLSDAADLLNGVGFYMDTDTYLHSHYLFSNRSISFSPNAQLQSSNLILFVFDNHMFINCLLINNLFISTVYLQ